MSVKRNAVFVNGVSYPVQERVGFLRADLHGIYGWTSVWGQSYTQLVRRIKWVLAGNQ